MNTRAPMPDSRDHPVIVMAGGTGGHIFPGLAVAEELRRRSIPVVWIGAGGALEERLVPRHKFPLERLPVRGVRGRGVRALLGAPLMLGRGVLAARRLLRKHAPRSVLSLGGYASAPGGLAARWARIPLVVHEQNRVPGWVNRFLARMAARVLTGFDGTIAGAEWTGNPVRADIAALPEPAVRFEGRTGALRLLVLGGSQGARSLNENVPEVLRRRGSRLQLEVRHQCGAMNAERTRAAYLQADVDARVEPFIDDMAAALGWADVVIGRAGALTLAELAAAGVASILVPFPHAVDDHQTRNAEVLVAAEAARLVPEGEDFVKRLGSAIDALGNRRTLLAMATQARTLTRPAAAARIADVCLEVAA